MPRRKTREEFISDAIEVHGDKYDYSQVEYINNKIPVKIYCKRCRYTFEQRPDSHLNGKGCIFCGNERNKTLLYGVAINDVVLGGNDKAYTCWKDMLERCYGRKDRSISYNDCEVCEEWRTFSNFWYWHFHNYTEGFVLDKDILTNGYGKCYSPETCLFVPMRINSLFIKQKNKYHKEGVYFIKRMGKFCAQLSRKGHTSKHLGVFNTEEEAHLAYKTAKEAYIKQVADEFYNRGEINLKVKEAMYNYKIF